MKKQINYVWKIIHKNGVGLFFIFCFVLCFFLGFFVVVDVAVCFVFAITLFFWVLFYFVTFIYIFQDFIFLFLMLINKMKGHDVMEGFSILWSKANC